MKLTLSTCRTGLSIPTKPLPGAAKGSSHVSQLSFHRTASTAVLWIFLIEQLRGCKLAHWRPKQFAPVLVKELAHLERSGSTTGGSAALSSSKKISRPPGTTVTTVRLGLPPRFCSVWLLPCGKKTKYRPCQQECSYHRLRTATSIDGLEPLIDLEPLILVKLA